MERIVSAVAVTVGVLAISAALLGSAVVSQTSPVAKKAGPMGYMAFSETQQVTIDWFSPESDVCGGGQSGCIDFDSIDSINVMSGQTRAWTEYVVLHEIGHVIQFRESGTAGLDECSADEYAKDHGAIITGYHC